MLDTGSHSHFCKLSLPQEIKHRKTIQELPFINHDGGKSLFADINIQDK